MSNKYRVWYAEYPRMDGTLAPCLVYHDQPSSKSLSGRTVKYTNVHELTELEGLRGLSLDSLFKYFNAPPEPVAVDCTHPNGSQHQFCPDCGANMANSA